jgi:hypothetical protein
MLFAKSKWERKVSEQLDKLGMVAIVHNNSL